VPPYLGGPERRRPRVDRALVAELDPLGRPESVVTQLHSKCWPNIDNGVRRGQASADRIPGNTALPNHLPVSSQLVLHARPT